MRPRYGNDLESMPSSDTSKLYNLRQVASPFLALSWKWRCNYFWVYTQGSEIIQLKDLNIVLFMLYWLCQTFDCVDHIKLWKILKEIGIPDHLTYLLRNLYAGQEATARTGHGTTDWFQIGKGVPQGCILSPCLFNLYAEYIMKMLNWMKHSLKQDCWEKYQ